MHRESTIFPTFFFHRLTCPAELSRRSSVAEAIIEEGESERALPTGPHTALQRDRWFSFFVESMSTTEAGEKK